MHRLFGGHTDEPETDSLHCRNLVPHFRAGSVGDGGGDCAELGASRLSSVAVIATCGGREAVGFAFRSARACRVYAYGGACYASFLLLPCALRPGAFRLMDSGDVSAGRKTATTQCELRENQGGVGSVGPCAVRK